MIEIADTEIYTTAQVNCLRERKDSRLVKAFFDVVEQIKSVREATIEA